MSPLLQITGLTVEYPTKGRRTENTRVIDALDLTIDAGATLALVGESGSGKSTLAAAVTGLVEPVGGSILFNGTELVGLDRRGRREIQHQIQMVFQNPLLSLSPRRRIGWQLDEPLRIHSGLDRDGRRDRALETMVSLDLDPDMATRFPHELSGGQAQRVVLARALVLEPSLIIFDEPTSALDVSVQASVLNLLQDLKQQRSLTYLFITHDLGVARHLADRIAVMRHGQIVERGPTADLFSNPSHPYTRTLLDSSPTA